MNNDFIFLIVSILGTFISSIIAYKLGKKEQENITLKNNEKIKRKFKSNDVNNINNVISKLQNGKF
jgi:membrane protein DedA with SNARE-associated domain